VTDDAQAGWKRALLEHRVRMNNDQSHSVVQKLRLLAPWFEPPGARLIAPAAMPLPEAIASALKPPYAVLQAPAAVAYKSWPLAHWRVLVAALLERGLQVVLTGAPSAGDRALVESVREGFEAGRVVDGAGRLDLNQVATLLGGAALYVGGDTSITHLAAACEIPVVALYGPINPRYFGPWPPSATLEVPYVAHALVQRAGSVSVLQGTPACVPCDRAGCEDRNDSASVCLQTMAPARVVAEVDRILASGRAAERQ
jgi:heptosyltransferase III